jgi:hypothetical protein
VRIIRGIDTQTDALDKQRKKKKKRKKRRIPDLSSSHTVDGKAGRDDNGTEEGEEE